MNSSFTLGLTGPTGAGKSLAAEFLRKNGFKIIDADAVSRSLTAEGSPVLQELAQAFGNELLTPSGGLNRRLLASIVFNNAAALQRLNGILHPKIMERIKAELTQAVPCVIDAPLLLEAKADELCNAVLAVVAPPELRLKRIMLRDSLSREEALKRMGTQQEAEYYISKADYYIINNGDEEYLYSELSRLITKISLSKNQ
ncbi:MAG: dephospho-CoA kinase [Oscillospiraceae bacterium]|jgi:dephospho-CoA kinase|nr:dephospho-CoA kinase [Oscillospiraceae bacterium]